MGTQFFRTVYYAIRLPITHLCISNFIPKPCLINESNFIVKDYKFYVEGVLLNDEIIGNIWHNTINSMRNYGYSLSDKKHLILLFLYKYY